MKLISIVIAGLKVIKRRIKIFLFVVFGKKPWSNGYFEFKWKTIHSAISDSHIEQVFGTDLPLPEGFGLGIDERAVEFPWALNRIPDTSLRLLDAGSTLNFKEILSHTKLKNKKIAILTLFPESNCFWRTGVSYVYDDIRALPFKDAQFDVITCLSTLEHVGMDNTQVYTRDEQFKEKNTEDYRRALLELKRVLRPAGKLLITVPYGKYMNFGGFFQQFDAKMIDDIIAVFRPNSYDIRYFKYHVGRGWGKARKEECDDVVYVGGKHNSEIAGASAVVGVELTKGQ